MTDETDRLAALRTPFAQGQIAKLPRPLRQGDQDRGKCERGSNYSADGHYCGGYHARAIHLDYVGHAALTDRLLDVDSQWTWEPVAFGEDGLPRFDSNGGLWIKLTVCGLTRLGYGDAQGKQGPNAVKEAIGDALRNAAMRFGAALDLWHKGDLHPQDDVSPEPPERPRERRRKVETVPLPEPVQDAGDVQARVEQYKKRIATALGHELNDIAAEVAGGDLPTSARNELKVSYAARVRDLNRG